MTPQEEQDFVVAYLKRLDRTFLPRPVFHAIEEKVALSAIETVFLRQNRLKVEVRLLDRPPDDEYYAGQVAGPGSMLLGGDVKSLGGKSFEEEIQLRASVLGLTIEGDQIPPGLVSSYWRPFSRICQKELGGWFKSEPIFVDTTFYDTPRGAENPLIYLCELDREPKEGRWYDVEDLPLNLVAHHHKLLAIAVPKFRELRRARGTGLAS